MLDVNQGFGDDDIVRLEFQKPCPTYKTSYQIQFKSSSTGLNTGLYEIEN